MRSRHWHFHGERLTPAQVWFLEWLDKEPGVFSLRQLDPVQKRHAVAMEKKGYLEIDRSLAALGEAFLRLTAKGWALVHIGVDEEYGNEGQGSEPWSPPPP